MNKCVKISNVVKTRWSSVTECIKNIHFMKEAQYE